MSLFYKLQQKKNFKRIIINLSIIFFLGFFSFYLIPKILSNSEYDYQNISFEQDKIDSINLLSKTIEETNSRDYFIKDSRDFLNKYFKFIISEPRHIYSSYCPDEILKDNMRSIHIYFNKNLKNTFSVRFYVNKFSFTKNEKSIIDKCFNFIFIENLNKFFKREFNIYTEKLKKKKKIYNDFYESKINKLSNYEIISYSDFVKHLNNNFIKEIIFYNDGNVRGFLKNEKFIEFSYPTGSLQDLFVNKELLQKIKNNDVQIKFATTEIDSKLIKLSNALQNLLDHFSKEKFIGNLEFVNTNQSLKSVIHKPRVIMSSFFSFIILLITTIIVQIFYQKYKKKILIFFK